MQLSQNNILKGLSGEIYKEIKGLKVISVAKKPVNKLDHSFSIILSIITLGAVGILIYISFFWVSMPWNIKGRALVIAPVLISLSISFWKGISVKWLLTSIYTYWFGYLFFLIIYFGVSYLFVNLISDNLIYTELAIISGSLMWLISITGIIYLRADIKMLKLNKLNAKDDSTETGTSIEGRYFGILIFAAFFIGGIVSILSIKSIDMALQKFLGL